MTKDNIEPIQVTESEALSHEGDVQACIGLTIATLGGLGTYFAVTEIEPAILEKIVAGASTLVSLGGLVMLGVGLHKIFQADKTVY